MYNFKNIPKEYNVSGIYCIRNKVNNKEYIGSSVNVFNRLKNHSWALRYNKHKNKILQLSFNKYNIDNFEVFLIEKTNSETLIEREQFFVDTCKPIYNIHKECVASCLGIKKSKEHCLKIKNRMQNFKHSEETKQLLSYKAKLRGVVPPKNFKKIVVLNLNNEELYIFNSLKETVNTLKIHHTTIINNCKGRTENYKNKLIFKYV